MRRVKRSARREFGPRWRCLVHAWCGSWLWFCSRLWFRIHPVAASVRGAIYAVMPGLRRLLSGELLFLLFFRELSPRCPDMRGLGHAVFFWSRLHRHEQTCWFCLALGLRCCGCMLGGRCNMRVRKIEEVGVGWTRCVGCVLWMHRPCIGLRLRQHADDFLQECGVVLVRCYQRNKAHVRRSMSACRGVRGVSTPWLRVSRARSVRAEKTVCTSLRRILLILIHRAIWHAAHVGCFACFIVKIVGLEPDAVWRMALRGWLRQAWRKSGSRAGFRLRGLGMHCVHSSASSANSWRLSDHCKGIGSMWT